MRVQTIAWLNSIELFFFFSNFFVFVFAQTAKKRSQIELREIITPFALSIWFSLRDETIITTNGHLRTPVWMWTNTTILPFAVFFSSQAFAFYDFTASTCTRTHSPHPVSEKWNQKQRNRSDEKQRKRWKKQKIMTEKMISILHHFMLTQKEKKIEFAQRNTWFHFFLE